MLSMSYLQRAAAAALCVVVLACPASRAMAAPPTPSPQDAPVAVAPTADEARSLQNAGRWEEAAEAWGLIVEAEPENGTAWFNYGYCLHAAGRLDKAIDVHRKAATFDEYHGIALYNLGCAHALLDQPDEAFEALFASQAAGFRMRGQAEGDSDLDSLRDDPRYAALLAREPAGFQGRLQQIVGRIHQTIQQNAPALKQKMSMMAQQAMGKAMHALTQFQQKLAQDERTAPLAQKLGELLGGGPPPQAGAAPAEPGDDLAALLQQAGRLQAQGQWLEAAAAYEIALRLDPENPAIWFNLAYCLHAGGEYEKAILAHQKAATFDATRGIALYNLGCAYALTGRPDEAMEALHASREAGFDLTDVIAEDSDLDSLRDDPRFMRLLTELGIDY